jgi:hypothetical protein
MSRTCYLRYHTSKNRSAVLNDLRYEESQLRCPPVDDVCLETRWCVAVMRPGRELLRNLATAVREAFAHDLGQPVTPAALTREHLLSDRALTDFLAGHLQDRGFLLVLGIRSADCVVT